MIYIIDYGFTNLFEILSTQSTDLLKIGEIEFKLHRDEPMTIASIPSQIFKQVALPSRIGHYKNGDETMSVVGYQAKYKELIKYRYWDDDLERDVFETREELKQYEDFMASWKPVYLEPETNWEIIEFEVIKKQFIEEKYRPIIVSQISVNSNPGVVESICKYNPSFEMMFRQIANGMGFVEIPDKMSVDTKGKKYSFNSGTRFSKCNDQYVSKFFEKQGTIFTPQKGLYEDCVKSFERDYNVIYQYINMVAQTVDNVAIAPLLVGELYEMIDNCITYANKVDSMKSTRDSYKALLQQLSKVKNRLLSGKS